MPSTRLEVQMYRWLLCWTRLKDKSGIQKLSGLMKDWISEHYLNWYLTVMLFWKQVPFWSNLLSVSVGPAQAMSYPIYNYGRFNTQPRTVSTNIAMFICNKHIKGSNLCNFMFITKSFPELLSTLVSYRRRIKPPWI